MGRDHAAVKRRRLIFSSFDELLAEVVRLQAVGYQRAGRWSLTQACVHLRKSHEMSMHGYGEIRASWIERMFGKLALPVALWTRWLPSGVKGPEQLMPAEMSAEDEAEIEGFVESVKRVQAFAGPFQRHPIFGSISMGQWHRFHLIHAAHHLNFLVPIR